MGIRGLRLGAQKGLTKYTYIFVHLCSNVHTQFPFVYLEFMGASMETI